MSAVIRRKGYADMDEIQKTLLEQVTGLHEIPRGAYNIRANGQGIARNSTANIDIIPKENEPGIDIYIKPNTKNEALHIPVLLTESGIHDAVYNDFYVAENADVTIIAGCGIHNGGDQGSEHNGIHRFFVGKNAKVRYVEKHYGSGDGKGTRIMNPTTVVNIDEGGYVLMELAQIKGIDSTDRKTECTLQKDAALVVKEKLMTHGTQDAKTYFLVNLEGEDSSANVVSRSVAKEKSTQLFVSKIVGNNKCAGHTECDAIIMDEASVSAVPELTANSVDASLIHEAAIGKIAGEQLMKLMTLGLTESEAEAKIVDGFLK